MIMMTFAPRTLHYTKSSNSDCRPWTRLLMIILLCGFIGVANAQQDVGFIVGTVTDSSGGGGPSAKRHIINDSTGITQDLTTNESGYYRWQPLLPATSSTG